MLPSSLKSSGYTTSVASSQIRKEVLWNVQEPGDPYDIRKSMIAKLPGGKTFMGDHLEFICLFQAAEIQRLSDFLQNYKYKFKDIERMTLDRHSYQIQIKELTLKLADEDNLRGQILKYKQFIKKQAGQIQALHQKLRQNQNIDDNFKTFYEQSNQKINILILENNELKKSITNYQSMLQASERAKIKEIQQFRIKITQTSQEQSDKNLMMFKNHIEGELKKLEFQIRKLKEQNGNKDKQIARLHSQIQEYQLQNQKIKTKNQNQIILQNRIKDNQTKIALFSQQIERLNMYIRQSNSKSEDYQRNNIQYVRRIHLFENQAKEDQLKITELKNEIFRLNEIIKKLEIQSRQNNQIQQYIVQYESRIKTLSTQIQSLNSKILYEANNSKIARQQAEKLAFENSKIKLLTKENSQLRQKINDSNEIKRKLTQYQYNLTLKNQQFQRLEGQLKNKDNQLLQLRGVALQNDTLKAKLNQLQITISRQYQTEILRIRTEYEQKITIISQNKVVDLESKVGSYQKELARIKQLLALKTDQYERQRLGYIDLEQRYKRYESQNSLKLKNYEISMEKLKRQNEDFSSRTRQISQYQRKIAQLQNRTNLLQAQCQRLNSLLKSREQQINGLKNKIRQLQGLIKKYELDTRVSIQQNITVYKSENEELKRKIAQLTSEFSKKNNQNFAEFSKLNTSMRNLLDQKVQLESQNKQYFQQLQFLRQNLQKITKENEQFRRKYSDIQNKLISSTNENTLNIKNWQIQNESLKRQNLQMKNSLSNYESEFAIRASRHEQNLTVLTKQNQQLRRRLREIQSTMPQLSLQFEKLSQKHKIKCDQFSSLEIKYQNSVLQIQNLRRYIKQYEVTVTNKYQVEVTRKYSNYQSTIQNINRQNEEFRRKYGDLQGRFSKLNLQYEKTIQNLKISSQENENLKRQLNQREVSSTNYESDANRKFANYETNINNLTRNYQESQRKITDLQLALKQRIEQYNRLDINYKSVIQENDNIRKRYKELEISTTQKLQGQVTKRYQNYQQTIAKLTQQNDQLKRKINQITIQHNKRVGQINTITPALAENENLKKKLEKYQVSIAAYETEVNRRFASYEQTIQTLSKDNQEYKRKIVELQNRFSLVSQELERTSNNLRSKNEQFNKLEINYRNIIIDLQNSRKKQVEMETHFNNIFENDVNKKYINYEQTIADLKRKLNELSLQNQNLTMEIQRTGSTLKVKGEESSQILVNFKNLSNQYEDFKRRVKENEGIYNQNLVTLRKENDDLKRKIQELQLNFRQLAQENQNKMKVVVQQIQRLNLTIKSKNQEIDRNRKQIKQFEISNNQKVEIDLKNKVYFENTVSSQVRQIQELRRRLQEFGDVHKRSVEFQSNLKITSLQLQKLRSLLKNKNDEFSNLELAYKNLMQQNEKIKFALKNTTQQLNKTDQKLRQLTIQTQNFRRQIAEQQRVTTNKYEVEITRRTSTFEQNINILNRQREQLIKKKSDYQNKIGLLTTEIERLNLLVKSRTEDLQRNIMETENLRQTAQKKLLSNESQYTTLQSNYKKVVSQYEISRKHLVQYETNIKKIHSQFERLQMIIDQLKKERQVIFDKNHFLSQQIERLAAENRDLETQTKDVRLRLSDQSSLQKRINQHLGLMVILFTEIESLRRRVTDKQKEVQHVRRTSLSPHILKH